MIQEFQLWVLRLNEQYSASPAIVNLITGLIVVMTVLSWGKFKTLYSSQYKWSKPLYYGGSVSMLLGVGINRLINYPPIYPLSSVFYLVSWLALTSFVVYAGYMYSVKGRSKKYGRKTINPTPHHQS